MRLSQLNLPALVLAAAFGVSAPARAGVLVPGNADAGEEFVLNLADPSFDGETLATRTTPFRVVDTDSETGESLGVSGSLTQSVVRESATGRLAFHYGVTGGGDNATVDFEQFTVGDFAGFDTDVFSSETSLTQGQASRSDQGEFIQFVGDESWGADFVVRTNATAFEDGGTGEIWASFQTGNPAGGSERFPSFVTFQPAAAGPGPTPIPLPPALWAGLSTMGVFGAVRAWRRRKW